MHTALVRSLLRLLAAGLLGTGLSVPARAQVVDPDPELFDGTRTKTAETPQEEQNQTVDDWEDANLIVYDSNEEGSSEGGQGRTGYKNPGMDIGVPNGTGMGLPIPLPIAGGGMPGIGDPSLSIPQLSVPTTPSDPSAAPAGSPGSAMPSETSPMAAAAGSPPAGKAGGGKPGAVSIGDASKQIRTTALNIPPEADPANAPSDSEDKPKGEDTTNIPNAASGTQSGDRGGGVEKGDGIPSDL